MPFKLYAQSYLTSGRFVFPTLQCVPPRRISSTGKIGYIASCYSRSKFHRESYEQMIVSFMHLLGAKSLSQYCHLAC